MRPGGAGDRTQSTGLKLNASLSQTTSHWIHHPSKNDPKDCDECPTTKVIQHVIHHSDIFVQMHFPAGL